MEQTGSCQSGEEGALDGRRGRISQGVCKRNPQTQTSAWRRPEGGVVRSGGGGQRGDGNICNRINTKQKVRNSLFLNIKKYMEKVTQLQYNFESK